MQQAIEHAISYPDVKTEFFSEFTKEKILSSLDSISGVSDFIGGLLYAGKIYREINNYVPSLGYEDLVNTYFKRKSKEISTELFRGGDSFKAGFQTRIKMKTDSDYYPFKSQV